MAQTHFTVFIFILLFLLKIFIYIYIVLFLFCQIEPHFYLILVCSLIVCAYSIVTKGECAGLDRNEVWFIHLKRLKDEPVFLPTHFVSSYIQRQVNESWFNMTLQEVRAISAIKVVI